jgi:hypothetical protein
MDIPEEEEPQRPLKQSGFSGCPRRNPLKLVAQRSAA